MAAGRDGASRSHYLSARDGCVPLSMFKKYTGGIPVKPVNRLLTADPHKVHEGIHKCSVCVLPLAVLAVDSHSSLFLLLLHFLWRKLCLQFVSPSRAAARWHISVLWMCSVCVLHNSFFLMCLFECVRASAWLSMCFYHHGFVLSVSTPPGSVSLHVHNIHLIACYE